MEEGVITPRHDGEARLVQRVELELRHDVSDEIADESPALVADAAARVERERQVDLMAARALTVNSVELRGTHAPVSVDEVDTLTTVLTRIAATLVVICKNT